VTTVSESIVETYEQIKPTQSNTHGNAHGGELVKLMDEIAAISAARVAVEQCVTARISTVNFHTPVKEGDVVGIQGYVYETGTTSLNVYTRAVRERMESGDNPVTATTAHFTMVAIDKDGEPIDTNPITVETSKDEQLVDEATTDSPHSS